MRNLSRDRYREFADATGEQGMTARYTMLAGYNRWANQRLYDAAAKLSDADYRADRGLFFRSVHGTLNHILVADRIWMKRFTGEGETYAKLDTILFEELGPLREARRAEDARIIDFVSALTPEKLSGTFRYQTITHPVQMEQELSFALDHFFNHQTHHRGQIHGALSHFLGNAATPILDLLIYQRETGTGGARKVAG
jgi:uncharacterized damage-inducible protein DinB